MIWVIARREFGAMFLSPLAWVILAVIQTILGYMFLTNKQQRRESHVIAPARVGGKLHGLLVKVEPVQQTAVVDEHRDAPDIDVVRGGFQGGAAL